MRNLQSPESHNSNKYIKFTDHGKLQSTTLEKSDNSLKQMDQTLHLKNSLMRTKMAVSYFSDSSILSNI